MFTAGIENVADCAFGDIVAFLMAVTVLAGCEKVAVCTPADMLAFLIAVTVVAGIESVAESTVAFTVTFVAKGYCMPVPPLYKLVISAPDNARDHMPNSSNNPSKKSLFPEPPPMLFEPLAVLVLAVTETSEPDCDPFIYNFITEPSYTQTM